jgi:hypothetical protein
LQASNKTNQEVKTEGGASYELRDQPMIWQAPLPTMNEIIAPRGTNIPMDKIQKDLINYDLEYFNFKDINNRLLVRCLSDYSTVSQDAVLRFTLYQSPGSNPHYYCKRDLIKRQS